VFVVVIFFGDVVIVLLSRCFVVQSFLTWLRFGAVLFFNSIYFYIVLGG